MYCFCIIIRVTLVSFCFSGWGLVRLDTLFPSAAPHVDLDSVSDPAIVIHPILPTADITVSDRALIDRRVICRVQVKIESGHQLRSLNFTGFF